MANKKISENSNKLLISIIVILLISIILLSYKLYTVTLMQSFTDDTINSVISATIPLPEETITKTPAGLLFTNPELGYTVNIPDGWTQREYKSLAGSAVQPYRDVIFLSPDYLEDNSDNADLNIEEGASIFIRGTDTVYKTIEERFANNVVAKRVATNVTRLNIHGIPAIQYEYELTGENVTNLTMIKDGIWYLIKFQYADSEAEVKYENVFKSVINSFKPK
ncbi:MAG: PsbP-like protein [Candidatus Parcubacteria bacterium]